MRVMAADIQRQMRQLQQVSHRAILRMRPSYRLILDIDRRRYLFVSRYGDVRCSRATCRAIYRMLEDGRAQHHTPGSTSLGALALQSEIPIRSGNAPFCERLEGGAVGDGGCFLKPDGALNAEFH